MYVIRLLFLNVGMHCSVPNFSSNTLFCFGQPSIHFSANQSAVDGIIVALCCTLWCGRDAVYYIVQEALDRVMLVSLCRIAARDSTKAGIVCELRLIQYRSDLFN